MRARIRRAGAAAGRLLASAAFALLLLGVPVLVLQAPFVTRALVARYYDPAAGGIPRETALRTAEAVRAYTTRADAPPLPGVVDGRPGFDEEAASHLRDVRRVLEAARAITLACAAALALALALVLPRRRYHDIAWVLRAGSLGILALAVASAVFAVVDFDAFFALFHKLFFAAGTWTFPAGTLLIELFPEPLWATLGVLWAAGVLTGALVSLAAAPVLSRRRRSVVSQDV